MLLFTKTLSLNPEQRETKLQPRVIEKPDGDGKYEQTVDQTSACGFMDTASRKRRARKGRVEALGLKDFGIHRVDCHKLLNPKSFEWEVAGEP